MADAVARIVIRGDTDDAVKGLKKVKDAVGDLDKQVSSKKNLFKEFLGGLGLGAGFFGAQAAARTLLEFGRSSLAAASDLQAMESRAKAIYGESFPRMKQGAEDLAQALGRSSSDLLGMSSDFATLARGAGLPAQAMEEMGQTLTKLSVDFASFRHISDEQSFDLIKSGLVGMTRGLKQYGVQLDDAAIEEFANAHALHLKVSELNEAQKTYLRYQMILKQTSDATGDATKNAGSLANQTAKLKAEWKDFQETIGGPATRLAAGILADINAKVDLGTKLVATLAGAARAAFVELAHLAGFSGVGVKQYLVNPERSQDRPGESITAGMQRRQQELKKEGEAAKGADAELRKYLGTLGSAGGSGGGSDKAEQAFKKLQETMEDLGRTYGDVRQDISRNLRQAETDHDEKMKAIADSVLRVKKSLTELDEQYARTTRNMNQDEVGEVLKQQEKIAQFKEKIADVERKARDESNRGSVSLSTNDELAELRGKLAKEESALAAFGKNKPGVVTQATAEGSKTEFERDLEKLDQRRADEEVDHKKRQDELNDEVGKLEEKRLAEEQAYGALRQQYASTQAALDAYHADYVLKMQDLKSVTEETAKAMKQALEDIRNSVSRVDAEAAASTQLGQRVFQRRQQRDVPALAEGGVVTRPTLALIGEAGPEAVVPLKKGGGMGVTIGAIHVHNEADEDRLIAKITRLIQLQGLAAS